MEGKKISLLVVNIIIVMLLAIPIVIAQPEPPENSYKTDFIAGGGQDGMGYDAGDIFVWIMDGYIYVQIQTNGDWLLNETHVHIDCSNEFDDGIDDIPTNKKGLPKIGKFEYKSELLFEETEQTFSEAIGDIEEYQFFIAVHGVVLSDVNGTESAWCEGIEFNEDCSWSMYVLFQDFEELTAQLGMDVFISREPTYYPLWGTANGGVAPYNYSWDLDMDGIYDDAYGDSIIINGEDFWLPDSQNTIGFRVEDNIGQVAFDTAIVIMIDLT